MDGGSIPESLAQFESFESVANRGTDSERKGRKPRYSAASKAFSPLRGSLALSKGEWLEKALWPGLGPGLDAFRGGFQPNSVDRHA